MTFWFELSRFFHVLGLSLTIGGIFTSFMLALKYRDDAGADKGSFVASHFVAAPGLMLVMFSGIWRSILLFWAPFKGSGFMHVKLLFVLLVTILLAIDIRTQGVIRRLRAKNLPVDSKLICRRVYALAAATVCLLAVIICVAFKPYLF